MNSNINNLIDAGGVASILKRISHEIVENCNDISALALIGIKSRGDYIASRISMHVNKISNNEIPMGTIDVAFHRDDYKTNLGSPKIGVSDIKFDVNGKDIVLIDDVLYTGRTIRAAMDEIFTYGRPSSISLAVIVDRGHRELPIRADYVGKNFPTAGSEHVHVHVKELDGEDIVFLDKGEG